MYQCLIHARSLKLNKVTIFTEYDKFNIGMQHHHNYAASIFFPLLNSRKFDSKSKIQKGFKFLAQLSFAVKKKETKFQAFWGC